MKRVLVVAPHPDDETLGCGGTMLRATAEGAEVYWLIVTSISEDGGFPAERIAKRAAEICAVAAALEVRETVSLGYPTAQLDTVPVGKLVREIGEVITRLEPTDIFLPYRRDAHSDHAVVFDASIAASKWFRYPSVKRVFAYETVSETDFDLFPDSSGFRPNFFVDVTPWLDRKIEIARIYSSELADHPFPRSIENLRALATVRGASAGFSAAEAFMLLRARLAQEQVLS